ncbi:MAG: 4Fe-4S binding protein [Cyclobacteriaceae bacterium]|nr:4Fe-4S binding protein [Cyclobacteriaceae bacterium]
METDVYHKLRKHLDQMPVPFPATRSGIEIELLKCLFTEDEAIIACETSAFPETPEKIHSRVKDKFSLEEVREKLKSMAEKGAILERLSDRKSKKLYHKIPLAVGMFEFQVNHLSKRFSELFNAYQEEAFFNELISMKTQQMRTIPVNVAIEHQFVVGNYDDIRKIVDGSPGPFALMNCVCRQSQDLLEDPCHLTQHRETCITMEKSARHMIRRGVAREITRKELFRFLTEFKKIGLVLQPENTQHPSFICCCCGCCCAILKQAARYDKPARFIHSNFRTVVNARHCDGCEKCMERCQMAAIIKADGHVEILEERCIGCGVCIPVCKPHAMKLVKKEKELVPPADDHELYKRMLVERFGLSRTVGMAAKSLVGMKV